MLGDIYLTLAWMAFQRMRYGSTRPREARRGTFEAPAVTAAPPARGRTKRALTPRQSVAGRPRIPTLNRPQMNTEWHRAAAPPLLAADGA